MMTPANLALLANLELDQALWVKVVAVVVMVLTIVLSRMNYTRRRAPGVATLEIFRCLAMALILFTLLKPEWVERTIIEEKPVVVVLKDISSSMTTRDVIQAKGQRAQTRENWVNQQLQTMRTNFFPALTNRGINVVVEDFALTQTNALLGRADGTDLHTALASPLKRYQKDLRAVLVLSDGDSNSGKDPQEAAMRLRENDVPVYSIAVGEDRWMPDVELEPVKAPSFGMLGQPISIPFSIRNHLPDPVKGVKIRLSASGVTLVEKEIYVPAFGKKADAIVWVPKQLGSFTLTLRVPERPGEYIPENNKRSFFLNVRPEKLNVLIVETSPRWEYRYLRNALTRDPEVETLHVLLLHPNGVGTGSGLNYISKFPETREQLAKYDVVFLGDVGMGDGELTEEQCQLIRGLVERQGSGLVFMPGPRGRQLELAGQPSHPLYDLLPVTYNNRTANNPWGRWGRWGAHEEKLTLTSDGRGHHLTLLHNSEEYNEQIWSRQLPGFNWCADVIRRRAGSQVLGVAKERYLLDDKGARIPLLVTQSFGAGDVLFMGTDSAWRWRRGVEDKYHYRFWGQVVKWMARKRKMAQGDGIRLTYTPENPQIGETLFLYATLLGLGQNQTNEEVTATLTTPSGIPQSFKLKQKDQDWGVYEGQVVLEEGGAKPYQVKLETTSGRGRLSKEIQVGSRKPEKLGEPAKYALLSDISDLTRGDSRTYTKAGEVLSQISALKRREPDEDRFQLWANGWWAAFLLLMLAVYWTMRKVLGLI